MSDVRNIQIPYLPRSWALNFHERKKRWNVLVLHRRAGKTIASLNELLKGAIGVPGRYAYVAPTYKQAKNVAWGELKKYIMPYKETDKNSPLYGHYFPGIPKIKINEAELTVTLPTGGSITLYGADNPDSLRGIGLKGVVFDEYSQQPANIFTEIIRPALSDHKGWAIWIGTPKGKNAFYELYERGLVNDRYFTLKLKASESGILDDEELLDARREMTEQEYNQEYECSFEAAIKGAYYTEDLQKIRKEDRRVRGLFDKTKEVYTFWDVGISDNTCVIFAQKDGNALNIIDCYSNNNKGMDHYSLVLTGTHEGFERMKSYRYAKHYFPHDVAQREKSSGKPLLDTMKKLFGSSKCKLVPKDNKVINGINQTRLIFHKLYFDKERTEDLWNALCHYTQEWSDKKGMFLDKPKHDWASHYADAFRYLGVTFNKLSDTYIADQFDLMAPKSNASTEVNDDPYE